MSLFIIALSALAIDYPLSLHSISAKEEHRYCGAPARAANGSIIRRADVLHAFKKAHPCPATGKSDGACPGWIMDHVIPLACGGCDAVSNLQWLTIETWKLKTGFERDPGVYSVTGCGQ